MDAVNRTTTEQVLEAVHAAWSEWRKTALRPSTHGPSFLYGYETKFDQAMWDAFSLEVDAR